jgi:hypothetical protein
MDYGDMPEKDEKVPVELLARIEEKLLRDLRPVKPLWPRGYFAAAFGTLFVAVVWAGVYSLGANGMRAMSTEQLAAVLSAAAVSVAALSDSMARQMAPGDRHWIRPRILPAAVIALLLAVLAGSFEFKREPEFWARGLVCARAGASFALLAAVPFWLLLRRGVLLSGCATGAAAGLLAGLAGTVMLELHCAIPDATHILTWHAGIAVLGALIGAGAGLAGE